MKKIVLVNPPFSAAEVVNRTKSMKHVLNILPPLGICYIAAVLEQNDFDVSIIDGQFVSHGRMLKIIEKKKPEIVGISATTPTFASAVKLAQAVKTRHPETMIIIGGSHVTAVPQETMQLDCFDVGVLGEAEITFLELAQGKALKKVNGIAYREKKQIRFTKKRELIKNLDELPFPARHLLAPLSKYHPTPASYKKLPSTHLMTTRGCPYSCTFCDRSIFGVKYRERSAENVMDEIELLINKFGVRDIKFFDDTFTLNKKRLYRICSLFKERGIDIPWSCLTKVNLVDKDILKIMKKAGCWQVLFGLESSDQRILDLIKKGTTVQQNERAVKLAHEVGLSVRADYIIGVPGDTLQNMRKTLQFAIKLNTEFAHFNQFTPFPGTELYEQIVKQGYRFDFTEIWTQLDLKQILYVPEGVNRNQYLKFITGAHKKYYLRPGYLWRQLRAIRSPKDIKRLYKGFITIVNL